MPSNYTLVSRSTSDEYYIYNGGLYSKDELRHCAIANSIVPNGYYIYNGTLYTEYELSHYGIPGMKWGVRRYQDKNGRLTTKGKERYAKTKSGMSKHAGLHPIHAAQANPNSDELHLRFIKACYDADTIQEVIEDPNNPGKFITPVDESIRKTRYRQDFIDDRDSVWDKTINAVNTDDPDRSMISNNCPKVAGTNCLAMMGYEYNAGRSFIGTNTDEAFNYWFNDVKRQRYDNVEEALDSYLSHAPNGSFGAIDLRDKNGMGGHVLNWQKKSTGEFGIYEGQYRGGWKSVRNRASDALDDYLSASAGQFDKNATVKVFDFTNATPNFEHIAEDSMSRIADGSVSSHLYDNLMKKPLD